MHHFRMQKTCHIQFLAKSYQFLCFWQRFGLHRGIISEFISIADLVLHLVKANLVNMAKQNVYAVKTWPLDVCEILIY